MKTISKSAAVLFGFFLALASPAQPIQTNSTFGWATLHNFTSATAITLGQNGFIYGLGESSPPSLYEMSTNGALLWTTPVTNSAVGNLSDIMQGADGNLYLNGSAAIVSASTNGSINWILPDTNNGIVNFLTCGADSNLYGVCAGGGANNLGQIVAIAPNGSYLWVFSFDGTNNGSLPSTSLVRGADGNIYGFTRDPAPGTFFSLSADGSLNSSLSLNGFTSYPRGTIIQNRDGNIYVSSLVGGPAGDGGVSSLSTNGSLNWSVTGPSDGSLILGTDGNLYAGGATHSLFCLTTNGQVLWRSNISSPATLQRLDGSIYGAGPSGIVCISPTGAATAVQDLPYSSDLRLFQDHSGNLFGSVSYNYGIYGSSSQVFELFAGPRVLSYPGDQIYTNRFFSFTNTVNYIGAPPFSFQWRKNGTNLTDGGTVRGSHTNQLVMQDVTSNASGNYSVIISNGFGVISIPFYIAATNRFPTLIPGGTFTVPNPSTFPNSSIRGSPFVLAAGNDGSLYGSTIDTFGASVYRVNTNGVIITSTQTGPSYINSIVQGTDGNVYCDEGSGLLVYSNNPMINLGSADRPTGVPLPAKIIQATDGVLYWTDEHSVEASLPGSSPAPLWSYSFSPDSPDSIVIDSDGIVFASAWSTNAGSVFGFSTNGVLNWRFTFDGTNGMNPGSIIQGSDGNLYGTTWGDTSGALNVYGVASAPGPAVFGSIFAMTTNGLLLWSLPLDGIRAAYPQPSLLQLSDGYLYGVASGGGVFNFGTIFRIAPGGVDFTIIHDFTGGADGAYPGSGLVQLSDGSLYGLACSGGTSNAGTLYRLDLPPASGAAVFQTAVITNSTISMTFAAIPNRIYQLQYSTDLATWANLNGSIPAPQSLITIQDAITTGPQRFYRLVRQ